MKTRPLTGIPFHLVLGLCLCGPGQGAGAPTIQGTASKPEGHQVAISWNTVATRCYTVETKSNLMEPWTEYAVLTATNELLSLLVTPEPGARFFRAAEYEPPPPGMALIPAGSFRMGDTFGEGYALELPVHAVTVSAFYMDQTEVTKALWDEVYLWATSRPPELRYTFDNPGCWNQGVDYSKGADHPVHLINWYDCVKWCNARSEKEGRVPAYYMSSAMTTVFRAGQIGVQNHWVRWNAGYRLPTEAEWEKAARGGLSNKRFPWGDRISHSQANYYSHWEGERPFYSYDVSPTSGYHPTYVTGSEPYTSPAGDFEPNDYGLCDMAGNVWEWCWDCYSSDYYGYSPSHDPRGPVSEWGRVMRGGSFYFIAGRAPDCRVANRHYFAPNYKGYSRGFRSVLPVGQ
ncbi:MAG TPA: SUMF1/EgtB/PvdO family nonheme iron enzyme [Verrucomicrobiota bacterium]|nr:SUMF1/EgtB/PvdO family nonheme iron enzyme [Verrucomicrobiota bacterium]HNU52240.1 SUMF1/EgtB/PvdO family nonheme iron enzyme [Verrucomicrobiota bacterium]